jgi:hypothetical protein
MDQQKAINVIGRILPIAHQSGDPRLRLDLTKCDFDGVDFSEGNYRAVDFSDSRFEGAILDGGIFEGCFFRGCLLNYARFYGANLKGSRFDYVVLNEPSPVPGGFVESINMADNLTGVTFIAADISAMDYLGTPEEISKMFATKDTKISGSVKSKMLNVRDHQAAYLARKLLRRRKLSGSEEEQVKALEKTGFVHWSPYDSSDLSTGVAVADFFRDLGMADWPFKKK